MGEVVRDSEVREEPGGASGHGATRAGGALTPLGPRGCPGVTAAGRPCGWPPLKGGVGLCWNHDERPEVVRRRTALKSAAVRTRVDWHTPLGQQRFAKRIYAGVEAGTMSRRRGDVLLRAMRVVARAQRRIDNQREHAVRKSRVKLVVKFPEWYTRMQGQEKK